MIDIKDKNKCCGCGACVQRCPKHCISMQEDEEGFLYPHVELTNCIDCGLCEKVCPEIRLVEPRKAIHVYAAKNKDSAKRGLSSSGGLFIALAEKIIERGGVVFGVVFDEKWEAHHVLATSIVELAPMMRSKYMQSRTENTFAEAEKFLKEGREVMYCGTPCQIEGLKLYLHKEYDNLLAVDIICHGVPSPLVWRTYLNEVVGKYKSYISDISFREKQRSGYDWKEYGFVIRRKTIEGKKEKIILSKLSSNSEYMNGFISNLYLRPSCYNCPSKGLKSCSDITIADYWGIDKIHPEFEDKTGTGLAIISSAKGKRLFDSCDIMSIDSSLMRATEGNKSFWLPTSINPKRKMFFESYFATGSVIKSVRRVLGSTIYKRIRLKLFRLKNN